MSVGTDAADPLTRRCFAALTRSYTRPQDLKSHRRSDGGGVGMSPVKLVFLPFRHTGS
jgi:hypothetical protein